MCDTSLVAQQSKLTERGRANWRRRSVRAKATIGVANQKECSKVLVDYRDE